MALILNSNTVEKEWIINTKQKLKQPERLSIYARINAFQCAINKTINNEFCNIEIQQLDLEQSFIDNVLKDIDDKIDSWKGGNVSRLSVTMQLNEDRYHQMAKGWWFHIQNESNWKLSRISIITSFYEISYYRYYK